MRKILFSIVAIMTVFISFNTNEALASEQTHADKIICMKSSSKSSFEKFMDHLMNSMIVKNKDF